MPSLNWLGLQIKPVSARFPHVMVAQGTSSFLPITCVAALRAVDAGTAHRMRGFSYCMCNGRETALNYGDRYAIYFFLSRSPDEDDGGW